MWGNGSGCSTKMSDVSISLRSLTKNERQWAIHSGHSPKVSESLIFLSESLIWSLFHHLLAKNKQFTKKTKERIPNPGVHHTAESSSAVCIILTPRSVSLRGVWLLIVLACAESDSSQANTAHSRKLKCPQIQNWLTLRGVKLIFSIFENLHFQGI